MKRVKEGIEEQRRKDYLFPLTISIMLLVVLFCTVTIFNSLRINHKVHIMVNQPFPVVVAAGHAETNMGKMKMLADQLKQTRNNEIILDIFEKIDKLQKDMNEKLDIVLTKGLYDIESGERLYASYEEIKSCWASVKILTMETDIDFYAIIEFLDNNFYSAIDGMQTEINTIISNAENNFRSLENSTEKLFGQNILFIISMLILILSMLIVFQNKLKQSRDALVKDSKLFNLISAGIDEVFVVRNVDYGILEYVSENAERVIGIKARHLMNNRNIFFDYIDKGETDRVRSVFEDDTSQKIPHIRFHYINPQNSKRCTIAARIYYDFYSDKKRKDIIIFSDETMQIEMNEKLEQAVISAQNANAAKSQFLSNMSHDIRTPMNAIIGMTAIAGNYVEGNEKLQVCLDKISVASRHLLSLISDVLDMSKIESGKLVLSEDAFDLTELIRNLITIIQQQIKEKQLGFGVTVKDLKEEMVYGDTLRINQILINIVGNAIKYTNHGGKIKIEISQKTSSKKGYGCYEFVVKDNGMGMNEQTLKKIFTPFERARNTTISGIEGSGLGMSIVKSIIEKMEGDIGISSKEGEGTEVNVLFYLKLQKNQNKEMILENADEFNVLVIDDDKDAAEITVGMLRELGVRSHFVLDGKKAIEAVEKAHNIQQYYSTIFVDWNMEEMDGIETVRHIREKAGEAASIVLVTGYDWTEIEEEAKAAGITAFMSKPVFKGRLYSFLKDIIGDSHQDKESEIMIHSFEGKRALLVEDNEINMEIASVLLSMTGITVENVWDGQEAVDRLQEVSDGYYNIIFMDIQMPRLDGLTATTVIRNASRNYLKTVPIIAMTANAFMDDINKSIAAGMNHHITKPIDSNELYRILNKYIEPDR